MVIITIVETKIEKRNKCEVCSELKAKADMHISKAKAAVPQKKYIVRITTTALSSFDVPFGTMKEAEEFEKKCSADGFKGVVNFTDVSGREIMLRQRCIETISILETETKGEVKSE